MLATCKLVRVRVIGLLGWLSLPKLPYSRKLLCMLATCKLVRVWVIGLLGQSLPYSRKYMLATCKLARVWVIGLLGWQSLPKLPYSRKLLCMLATCKLVRVWVIGLLGWLILPYSRKYMFEYPWVIGLLGQSLPYSRKLLMHACNLHACNLQACKSIHESHTCLVSKACHTAEIFYACMHFES